MALVYDKTLVTGFKYIIESERGEKKPFSVTLKPIDSVRLVQLEDGLLKRSQDNSLSISSGSHAVSICRNAITGWENLNGADGKPLGIQLDPKDYISEHSLAMLPTSLITEISGVITAVSNDPSTIQTFRADEV